MVVDKTYILKRVVCLDLTSKEGSRVAFSPKPPLFDISDFNYPSCVTDGRIIKMVRTCQAIVLMPGIHME